MSDNPFDDPSRLRFYGFVWFFTIGLFLVVVIDKIVELARG